MSSISVVKHIKIYDGKPLKTLDFQGLSPFLDSDFRRQKSQKKPLLGIKLLSKFLK